MAAGVALMVAGCGSSGTAPGVALAPSAAAATSSATTTTATATTSTTSTAVKTPSSGPLAKEPVFDVTGTTTPSKLIVKDLIVGTGAVAGKGDEVWVNYVGKLYKNGKVFDSSWKDTPGETYGPIQIGAGTVIPGWEQGLVGMRVGGRRELIIPPSLAYGKSGSGSTIPGNSTLVFVIDLVKVSK